MAYTSAEIRDGLRDGSIVLCLPPAHENFTNEFLADFSARVLGQEWADVAPRAHLQIPALVEESADDLAETIHFLYGADVSDLPGLPLWEVMRRCAHGSSSIVR